MSAKGTKSHITCIRFIPFIADPESLNPVPDPAFQVIPDTDPDLDPRPDPGF
jgi:hypothetical protein